MYTRIYRYLYIDMEKNNIIVLKSNQNQFYILISQ